MKAIIYSNRRNQIRLVNIPIPRLRSAKHVLVKIEKVGICGTDRDLIRQKDVSLPKHKNYIIIGHEAVGTVVKIGRLVHKLNEGDWVVPTVSRGCERCRFCRLGSPDLCNTPNLRERGVSQINGFMTEYIVEQERNLIKIPNALANFAVLIEPFSIALKISDLVFAHFSSRMKLNVRNFSGLRCLVLGYGAIGALVSILFKFLKAKVTLVGRRSTNSKHVSTLKQIKISYLCDKRDGGKIENKLIKKFDILVDTTGNLLMVKNALAKLKTNGIIILLGIKNHSLSKLNCKNPNEQVIRKGLTISCVHGSNMIYMKQAIKCLIKINRQYPNFIQKMLYQEIKMNKFLDLILNKRVNTIKTVLCFK